MRELGLTAPQVAEKAQVHPSTVRAFVNGTRWPHATTRNRIVRALGLQANEVARRVWGGQVALDDASTDELVRELCRRFSQDHPHVREKC